MGCSLDVKGFIKIAQIRRRDLQCACTFGTISVYRYATQMQQCRVLFWEAVDNRILCISLHLVGEFMETVHMCIRWLARECFVWAMQSAGVDFFWLYADTFRRLRSETAFLCLLVDDELQWSAQSSFLIHLIQIWSLISVCCSYDAHTWSQWQEVFASAYVFMEWFTLGECALLKLITIFSSQFGTAASVFVLTARQVSFLTAACCMAIGSLSLSCQLDLMFDIVLLLGQELLFNIILIGRLMTRDGFNLLVTFSDTMNCCRRMSGYTRRMMLTVVALYLVILDNIRFSYNDWVLSTFNKGICSVWCLGNIFCMMMFHTTYLWGDVFWCFWQWALVWLSTTCMTSVCKELIHWMTTCKCCKLKSMQWWICSFWALRDAGRRWLDICLPFGGGSGAQDQQLCISDGVPTSTTRMFSIYVMTTMLCF